MRLAVSGGGLASSGRLPFCDRCGYAAFEASRARCAAFLVLTRVSFWLWVCDQCLARDGDRGARRAWEREWYADPEEVQGG
jgi:hypothetical protein